MVALTLALWIVYVPFTSANWPFRRLLAFVGLTAPPGALEAIPWTHYMTHWQAELPNTCLALVGAVWRIALLLWFLKRSAGLSWLDAALATLLPLNLIVLALAQLDVRHPMSDYVNYGASLDVFALLAFLALPLSALAYVVAVARRFVALRLAARAASRRSG